MTRPPDKNAKTIQIIVQAKTVEEVNKIKAVKDICIRNSLHVKDEMFALMTSWLLSHHWPETDGHSQYMLTEFDKPKVKKSCQDCERKPVHYGLKGTVWLGYCEAHFVKGQWKSWR